MKTKILFILILIWGCTNKHCPPSHQEYFTLLTNDSIKYWGDLWKMPYFNQYREGGLAFLKSGQLINYQFTDENKRIITDNDSGDVICVSSTFYLKSDTLFIHRCGWTFVLRIEKLSSDTLQLNEITKYGYFPDLGRSPGSIPVIYIRSQDQITRPIEDYQVYTNGPVTSRPINK